MRIYLSLLCLALSPLSYSNDLISGYQWRNSPASLIKTPPQNKPQSQQIAQPQNLLANEQNNKDAKPKVKSSPAPLNCKQTKRHC